MLTVDILCVFYIPSKNHLSCEGPVGPCSIGDWRFLSFCRAPILTPFRPPERSRSDHRLLAYASRGGATWLRPINYRRYREARFTRGFARRAGRERLLRQFFPVSKTSAFKRRRRTANGVSKAQRKRTDRSYAHVRLTTSYHATGYLTPLHTPLNT